MNSSLTSVPGKMTRRLGATSLIGQSMTVFFGGLVARQLEVAAGDPDGRADTYLFGGIGLAVLCILVSGLLRRPGGVLLGWGVQALTLASAVILPAMAIVAVIFGALWWLCLSQGHTMDQLTAQRESAPHTDSAPGTDHTPPTDRMQHPDDRPKDD